MIGDGSGYGADSRRHALQNIGGGRWPATNVVEGNTTGLIELASSRTSRGSACTLTASGFPQRRQWLCSREICLSIFCLELSFFFCASCAVFAPLRLRASSVRFAVPQCSQRPNSLNASSRLVLDCRDSLAVCSAESDRVLRNPMRRMIVLAAGSRR